MITAATFCAGILIGYSLCLWHKRKHHAQSLQPDEAWEQVYREHFREM